MPKNIPIYEIKIDDSDESGVFCISLVDNPAIMVRGLALANAQKEKMQLFFDKEKQIVAAPVLIPNQLIYRYDFSGEYFVIWTKEVIRKCFEKYLSNPADCNLQHSDITVPAKFESHWIIENENDRAYKEFGYVYDSLDTYKNLPFGSWFAVLKVENEWFWDEIVKKGGVNSFSVEAFIDLDYLRDVPAFVEMGSKRSFSDIIKNLFSNKTKKNNSADALKVGEFVQKTLLLKLAKMDTYKLKDGAVVAIGGDGIAYVIDESGAPTALLQPGAYETEDGQFQIVVDENSMAKIEKLEAQKDDKDKDSDGKTDQKSAFEQKALRLRIEQMNAQIKSLEAKQKQLLGKPDAKPVIVKMGADLSGMPKTRKEFAMQIRAAFNELRSLPNKFEREKRLKELFSTPSPTFPDYGITQQALYGKVFAETVLVNQPITDVFENVVSKINLPRIDNAFNLQENKCDLDPGTSEMALENVELSVCDYAFHDQFCLDEFKAFFDQRGVWDTIRSGQHPEIPQIIMDLYMSEFSQDAALKVEDALINGNTAIIPTASNYHLQPCDGFLVKFLADGAVHDVAAAVAIDETTVIDELKKAYALIPNALLRPNQMSKQKLYILGSFAMFRALQCAYYNATGFFQGQQVSGVTVSGENWFFFGIPIYFSSVMPDDTFWITTTRNLAIGTDLVSDYAALEVINEFQYKASSQNIGVRGRFRLGNAYRRGDYVVLHNV